MVAKRNKFPFYLIPLLIIGFIVIGYSIAWYKASQVMETIVYDWIADQRANDTLVEHGDIKIHGFPFFLRATIEAPKLEEPQNWQWQSESLDIDVLPYDFSKIIFSPKGTQNLKTSALAPPYNEIQANAEIIRISLGRDKKHEWLGAAQIHGATLQTLSNKQKVSFDKLLFNIMPQPDIETTINTSLQINQLEITNIEKIADNPLSLEQLQLSMSASHTDQLSGDAPYDQWAQAGGAFKLHYLIVDDDPAQLAAKGALSVDNQGFPVGDIQTRLIKPANFLATITKSGALTKEENDALSAGLSLALLSGRGAVEKIFVFRNGIITLDNQKIADLPNLKN